MKLDNQDREWVPTCFMMAVGPGVRTKIVFSPMQYQNNDRVHYRSQITVFSPESAKPCARIESPLMPLRGLYTASSDDLVGKLSVKSGFFYCEALNFSPDMPPQDANITMGCSLHYESDTSSLQGHVVSGAIFGAPRKVYNRDNYYDHFPYGIAYQGTGAKIYLLNPYVRTSNFKVTFVNEEGVCWESPMEQIKPKGAAEWFVDFDEIGLTGKSVSAIVSSELKLHVTYALYSTENNVMYGMDHGHPFLDVLLNH